MGRIACEVNFKSCSCRVNGWHLHGHSLHPRHPFFTMVHTSHATHAARFAAGLAATRRASSCTRCKQQGNHDEKQRKARDCSVFAYAYADCVCLSHKTLESKKPLYCGGQLPYLLISVCALLKRLSDAMLHMVSEKKKRNLLCCRDDA